jgi:TPR repeat protein
MMRRLREYLVAACLGVLTVLGGGAPVYAQNTQTPPIVTQTDDPDLAFQYAEALHEGSQVEQDFALAAAYYRIAALGGNAVAQNRLGRYLQAGVIDAPDPEGSIQWFELAAEQGNPEHIFDLGRVYELGLGVVQNGARAAKLYQEAAAAGSTEASVSLAVLLQSGTYIPQDLERARALYQDAAALGDARAQNNLGTLYARGEGVAQDYERAADLFAQAAAQGMTPAMTNLGGLYENGFGVELDEARAAELYRAAAELKTQVGYVFDPRLSRDLQAEHIPQLEQSASRGDPIAQFLLAYIILTLPPAENEPVDFRSAAQLLEQAAARGIPAAQANLGLMYYRGNGVPQDFVEAYSLLLQASTSGNPEILALRDYLSQRIAPTQIRAAQSR